MGISQPSPALIALSSVDIGDSDRFVEKELRGIALSLRHQPGYDHSYYFISKFMPDHVAWHAERLRRG
jgi:S-formylglutathione hydrolase